MSDMTVYAVNASVEIEYLVRPEGTPDEIAEMERRLGDGSLCEALRGGIRELLLDEIRAPGTYDISVNVPSLTVEVAT